MATSTVIARQRRHVRLRKKVEGSSERPRLCIFRTTSNIYAQIIDDTKGHTLVAVSSLEKTFVDEHAGNKGNIAAAKKAGELIARKAVAAGIKKVVFDRGGFLYHGRVKALADAAREAGLDF